MPKQERSSTYIPQNERLAIPNDWDELIDGYDYMVLCVPNSTKWKIVIRDAIRRLTYGRYWRRDTGTITEAQRVIEDVMESIDVATNELTRIADGVEALCGKIPDAINLQDFLNDMIANRDGANPIDGIATWVDLFLRLNDLYDLIPNIDIRIDPAELARLALEGLSAYNTAKWRSETLQIQKAGLLTSSGPDAALIVQEIVNALPLLDVADTFTDIDESVLTIAGAIITAITGNYETNRLAEIRDALGGSNAQVNSAFNLVDEIARGNDGLDNFIAKFDNKDFGCSCGVAGCDGCQPPAYGEPETPEAPPEGDEGNADPPPVGFATWAEFRTYKCKAANRLVDELIQTCTNLSSFSGALAAISVAAFATVGSSMLTGGVLVGLIGASFGTGLVAGIVIGAIVFLAGAGLGLFDYFGDLANELSVSQNQLVCDVYAETTVQGVKNVLIAAVTNALDGITFAVGDDAIFEPKALEIVTALLGNEAINAMFTLDDETNVYVGSVDCATCSQMPGIYFVLGLNNQPRGTGVLTPDGTSRVLNSTQDSNGLHYIEFKVDVEENSANYVSDCSQMPLSIQGTADENFDIIIEGSTVSTQSDAYRCAPLVHTQMWGPSLPALNVPFNVSWVDGINLLANGPFTMTVKIGAAGTL